MNARQIKQLLRACAAETGKIDRPANDSCAMYFVRLLCAALSYGEKDLSDAIHIAVFGKKRGAP